MLKSGIYIAAVESAILTNNYEFIIEVEEKPKSYVFKFVRKSGYPPTAIEAVFDKKNKITIYKDMSQHSVSVWSEEDFTIYPFRMGVPIWFEYDENTKVKWRINTDTRYLDYYIDYVNNKGYEIAEINRDCYISPYFKGRTRSSLDFVTSINVSPQEFEKEVTEYSKLAYVKEVRRFKDE
jgi:hypothetical protein